MSRRQGRDYYQYESWSDVRREIEDCLQACPTFRGRTEVAGRLKRVEGLSHENYHFCVKDLKEEDSLECFIYRRISPRGVIPQSETSENLRRETLTLSALKRIGCPFRHPEVVWIATDASRPRAFIETVVEGFSANSLAKSPRADYLIDQIGAIAAQVHRLPKAEFLHLTHTLDSREHLESRLTQFPEAFWRLPVPREARQWIREHAGPARRAVILHGDLLPQNLVFSTGDEPRGVLDWEFAGVGDAAFDLAIVTRATRRLFGLTDGRDRLLGAYRQAGGQTITEADVVAHELLLVAGWMWEAAERERKGPPEGQTAAFYEQMLQALLRRAPKDQAG